MKKCFPQFFLLVLFLINIDAYAIVSGNINGKVIDKKTGEELIGVTILVEGTSLGAVTDFEGKYHISGVSPGTYKLVASYISYNKKIISGVEVKPKETISLSFSMEIASKDLNEFVVVAEFKKESANALLVQQKNAVSVSSGVSADLIRKTPDRTTADVLKRISGASIQDNKFAIVRGLNDRYNMGYLNGAPLPSSESDRKAFSLDIIPASVIDNMQIIKGASPDMPGDFAGGIIQINTKDIPDENKIAVNFGSQYHSLTTFKNGLRGNTSSTDWLGFDGGARQIPSGLMSTEQSKSASNSSFDFDQKAAQTKSFNNNFQPNSVGSFRPNYSFQLSASKRMKLFKNDFGMIFALSYNNSFKYTPFSTNNLPVLGMQSVNSQTSDGTFYNYDNYKNNITSGAVLNFAYKIGKNSKLTFKNMLTSNSEDQTIHQTGIRYLSRNNPDNIEQTKFDNYTFYYQSSRLYSSQLSGEHLLTKNKIKLNYTGSLNTIHREMPDYRRILYQSNKLATDPDFNEYSVSTAGDANSYSPQQSGRYFSNLDEKMYSVSYDLTIPFKVSVFQKSQLKIGGMNIWRDRSFSARSFMYTTASNYYDDMRASQIARLDPGQVFANQNIDKSTFFLNETTQGTDAYIASSRLNAGYLMLDIKTIQRLRVIGGIRLEDFNQKLSWTDKGIDVKVNKPNLDFLPSVNMIYELNSKANLRASASKTLSRPEFRELASMAFYEINYNAIITGNPDLVRTEIYNYDVKFEYFPTSGQLFSVNPFYKNFINPVEAKFDGGGTGINSFTYINASQAVNYGVEFEGRLNLASLFKENTSEWINNFTLFANYSLIYSNVKLNDSINKSTNSVNTRPLQGQSPYVFNMGILYSNPKNKFDISITANQIGRRLAFVNDAKEFLIYEDSRTVIDMSVSKTFFKKLITKITLGDILAQPLVFYQDLNSNGKYDEGSDVSTFKYKYGYTIQLHLGYSF